MTDNDTQEPSAFDRGAAALDDVYAGDVVAIPKGAIPFNDVMLETLFAGVWTRDVLSVRDRRLLIMGVIAANGAADTWKIQAKAALKRGDLTVDELRETLITLAPYAGYPSVSSLVAVTEGVIHESSESSAPATDDAGT